MASEVDGTPFGRYRLVDLLGRGGMGEVWRAYDPVNARFVALKVLPANFAGDAMFQERFRREARAAARLDEPHVVPIYDSGEIDGHLFVSMRLVKGHDLQELLATGPLPPARIVSIVEQIAFALDAAHQVGLVHRDVKPSNILVADNDFAYLIDFGIARAAGETGLTSTGSTIGTWAYMAPERFARGGAADTRADTYALACVLHQGLTGQPPFPADTIEQIAVAHMVEAPPKPSGLQAGVPVAMDQVIATGMAKDPGERYASTVELARAARAALDAGQPLAPTPLPPAPMPPTPVDPAAATTARLVSPPPAFVPEAPHSPLRPTRRRRAPWVLAAIGVTVAVVIGVVTVGVLGKHRASPSGSQTQQLRVGAESDLPFSGLNKPGGVAVDGSGAVYIADIGNRRVVKLAAGVQSVLPFTGLDFPRDVAVDGGGAVYVVDATNKRVVKLADGVQSELPAPSGADLFFPEGVAVDGSGAIYVTDQGSNRVVKWLGGAPTVLPGTSVHMPDAITVDGSGAVYIVDTYPEYRLVKWVAGAPTVLPFSGFNNMRSVAIDGSGAVYVVDSGNRRVVKMVAGLQSVLPFTGLEGPVGVAVDSGGAAYVTDPRTNRVVKLSPS